MMPIILYVEKRIKEESESISILEKEIKSNPKSPLSIISKSMDDRLTRYLKYRISDIIQVDAN